ncbi:MAG: hypothetical protein IJI58_04260 [Bacilli bacterium]|nr:hypothetical protein [Bacilli bacterium]
MKKNNNKGFVLAETLVVTVFLMTIFSMIYYYFYPLMGEYEKREVYDDVDDKYSVFWIKRIIEDSEYSITAGSAKANNFQKYGYFRFECKDVPPADEKRQMCKTLVNALQVEGCSTGGNNCNIFITAYQLGGTTMPKPTMKKFKDMATNATNPIMRWQEDCDKSEDECKQDFLTYCGNEGFDSDYCAEAVNKKVFNDGFQDYIELLPDYRFASKNGAKYRIIVSFQHLVDNNNYYSYANIEVGG